MSDGSKEDFSDLVARLCAYQEQLEMDMARGQLGLRFMEYLEQAGDVDALIAQRWATLAELDRKIEDRHDAEDLAVIDRHRAECERATGKQDKQRAAGGAGKGEEP